MEMRNAEKLFFLKSFFMIVVYFVAVFYIGFFVSGIITFFALSFFEMSDPEFFIPILGTSIICIIGSIDFYLSFKGKWSPVSFILSIPVFAGMLLKAILNNSKNIQFDLRPPRFNGIIKEISKIRFH